MISGYIADVCKVGRGAACCRYVVRDASGWQCGKVDPALKGAIDARCGTMRAEGDNCPGVPNLNETELQA